MYVYHWFNMYRKDLHGYENCFANLLLTQKLAQEVVVGMSFHSEAQSVELQFTVIAYSNWLNI